MSTATERVAAVRDVLRHLNHPERLRQNPLVAAQFSPGCDPAVAAARVERLIEGALAELPSRLREIVRRCDLRGELHASAMTSLALSKRHFYRERLRALEAVGATLAHAASAASAPAPATAPDGVGLQLCLADAAFQVGDVGTATRAIAHAERHVASHEDRVYLACRLAELDCEAGNFAGARGHIARARAYAAPPGDEATRFAGRIDVAEGTLAWRSGECELGAASLEAAVFQLRRGIGRGGAPRDVESLANALLVLSERDLAAGKAAAAGRRASEAAEAIAASDPGRPALHVRVKRAATIAKMNDPACLRDAAFELEALYRGALASGLTLEATIVGCSLSNIHRFGGNPRRAISALRAMLPVARTVLKGNERAGISLDLAINHVACREPAEAHRTIADARKHATPGGFVAALAHLIAADAYLTERRFEAALASSREAVNAMQRLGRQTSIGPALRVQADAIHGLGDVRAASDVIEEALSSLDRAGHPYLRATAHRSAAQITGKRSHRRIAEDIFITLRPAAV